MTNKLDQLEAKLQSLVEDQLVKILPGLHVEDRVIQRLSAALKQNIVENSGEGATAPNVYTLIVSTDSSPMWKEQSTLDVLKNIITTAGKEAGLKFTGNPTISITTDENFTNEDISGGNTWYKTFGFGYTNIFILSPGEYTVELYADNILVQSGTFFVQE